MLNESIIEGASAACGVIATIADENLTVAHGDLLPSELATLMANAGGQWQPGHSITSAKYRLLMIADF